MEAVENRPVAGTLKRHAVRQLRKLRSIANSDGADSVKGVHDMRVALRRLRLLARLAKACKLKGAARLGKKGKRYALLLGGVRDRDVLIKRLTKDAAKGKLENSAAIAWLGDLREERGHAVRGCEEAFQKEKAARAMRQAADWAARGPQSGEEEGSLADLLKDHFAAVEGATNPQDLAAAHRLRIECKRLRYLLEFFEAEIPGSTRAVKQLTKVQDLLGDLRDRQIAAELATARGLGDYAASTAPSVDEARLALRTIREALTALDR